MKKEDGISFILSVIINIIILLFIPKLSNITKVENKKIKVGLIVYESKLKTKLPEKKNSNVVKAKNNEKKGEENKNIQPKKGEQKKENNKKISALSDLDKNIETLNTEISPPILFPKETGKIKKVDVVRGNNNSKEDKINLEGENIGLTLDKVEGKDEEKLSTNEDMIIYTPDEEDIKIDKILNIKAKTEGLPSGYKLGTDDGDIIARWDSSNKEPIYPETAQLKGLFGSVKLRLTIDEKGNVKDFKLEKGSGVPEINNAIEEIARTWKIYLSKNGLNVKGDVVLEYNFVLQGKRKLKNP